MQPSVVFAGSVLKCKSTHMHTHTGMHAAARRVSSMNAEYAHLLL